MLRPALATFGSNRIAEAKIKARLTASLFCFDREELRGLSFVSLFVAIILRLIAFTVLLVARLA